MFFFAKVSDAVLSSPVWKTNTFERGLEWYLNNRKPKKNAGFESFGFTSSTPCQFGPVSCSASFCLSFLSFLFLNGVVDMGIGFVPGLYLPPRQSPPVQLAKRFIKHGHRGPFFPPSAHIPMYTRHVRLLPFYQGPRMMYFMGCVSKRTGCGNHSPSHHSLSVQKSFCHAVGK